MPKNSVIVAASPVAVGLGACGLLLLRWSAPAAVLVSFAGLFAAFYGMMSRNELGARVALLVSGGAHALVVGLVSRSLLLPVAPLALTFAFGGLGELTIRSVGYKATWLGLVGVAAALGLAALSLPLGQAHWAILPTVGFAALNLKELGGLRLNLAKQSRDSWAVEVGSVVPDFELPIRGSDGERFRLSDERGRHVLISFSRGDWCPVCYVYMNVYRKEANRLAASNVRLVVISPAVGPRPHPDHATVGEHLELEDPDNEIARRLGALYKGGKGPIPVSFLVDPAGRLAHAQRPDDVEAFLDPRKLIDSLVPQHRQHSPA